MSSSSRGQPNLHLGQLPSLQATAKSSSATSSPIEPLPERTSRFGGSSAGMSSSGAIGRMGSSSPSHEGGGRYFSRRARELQQSEGHGWGPPVASGLSTPLRETIPESPGDDTFPDFNTASLEAPPLSRHSSVRERRTRAGTTPSRFPGQPDAPTSGGQQLRNALSSRASPSASPHRPGSSSLAEQEDSRRLSHTSSALARLRAGSTPNRSSLGLPIFGPSIWSSDARSRSTTLGSHNSDDNQASTSDPFYETDRKTLALNSGYGHDDLLGRERSGSGFLGMRRPMASDLNRVPSNRFRSYSTNAKEKYASEEDAAFSPFGSGTLTPSRGDAALLATKNAQISQYNRDVQSFINQFPGLSSSVNRPRSQTASVMDTSSGVWRSRAPTLNRLEQPLTDFQWSNDDTLDYESLTNAVKAMQLQNPTLGQDLPNLDERSRAIWLGGIPSSTTTSTLKALFQPFGKIESARVMTQKGYGFVNFEHVNSAIMARAQRDGQELFPGHGPIRIGFAKDPSHSSTPGLQDEGMMNSASIGGQQETSVAGPSMSQRTTAGHHTTEVGASDLPQVSDVREDLMSTIQAFGASGQEQAHIGDMINRAMNSTEYVLEVPALPEPSQVRIHDAPRLREIRKRIDNNAYMRSEIEEIALQMLPEVAELSFDYLGNTVVQKLFENCSEPTKEAMLREIQPYLAQIGVHKNGTWAAQTILRVANTPQQQMMIAEGLRPYAMALFVDQYGNYVMQGCLKFGTPMNDFVFEAMITQLWPIAEARFGARAMRACLESQDSSKDQQRMMASLIALYSNHLATNANGALLLTWYLDTCNLKHRRSILAPRLIPHLVQLCTHKVAYMTVLKLINQKDESNAREQVLRALFSSPNNAVLEAILKDQVCGPTFIFKTLTTPFFDEHLRDESSTNVRKVLQQIKAQPNQTYKRLMDEVGLTRGGPMNGSNSNASPKKGRINQQHANGGVYQGMPNQSPYSPASTNGGSAMNGNFEPSYYNGMNGQQYAANSLPSPMTPHQGPPASYQQPSPYATSQSRYNYGPPPPMMNTNGYPTPMSSTYGRSPQPQHYPTPGASPMMPQHGHYHNPMMGMNGAAPPWQQYGAPPAYGMPQQPPMYGHDMMPNGGGGPGGGVGGGGGRRGRR